MINARSQQRIGLTAGLTQVALVISLFIGIVPASAHAASGYIKGRVAECSPGPTIPRQQAAKPAMVVLLFHNLTFESESIRFPTRIPWVGVFEFKVAPGRYEVISTYAGPARWVTVISGRTFTVSFGPISCPD